MALNPQKSKVTDLAEVYTVLGLGLEVNSNKFSNRHVLITELKKRNPRIELHFDNGDLLHENVHQSIIFYRRIGIYKRVILIFVKFIIASPAKKVLKVVFYLYTDKC